MNSKVLVYDNPSIMHLGNQLLKELENTGYDTAITQAKNVYMALKMDKAITEVKKKKKKYPCR